MIVNPRLPALRRAIANGNAFPCLIGKRAASLNLKRLYLGALIK